jgi:hypothetical protein
VGGFVATFAIVAGLLVALPNHPTLDVPGGSVYTIDWHATAKLPVATFDYGPYFATVDDTLLMVGTVNSTTTVWSSSDGSTWSQRSSAGAFGMDGRTFVAQGIADDGNGGLIVVGNSLGSSATDVAAAAWHSHDGSAWTQMEVDYGNGQLMGGGVATQGGTSVSAGNGVAWLSINGSSWAPIALPGAVGQGGAFTPSVVGTWDGGFMIVGLWIGSGATRSAAWYSSTGRDWVEAATSLNGFMAVSCSAIDGRFVAVGSDLGDSSPGLSASWSTADGKTWTESTAPTDLAGVAIDGVTRVGNSLVSFGAPTVSAPVVVQAGPTLPGSTPPATVSELVWVTDDGVNWIPIQSKAAPIVSAKVTSVGNRVVLVGQSAAGLVSLTGDLALGAARPISGQLAAGDFVLSLAAGNVPMTPDVTKGYSLGPTATSADRFYVFATGPTGTSIFNSTNGGLWVQELRPTGLTKIATSDQAVITGRPIVLQAISDGHGGIIAVGKITNTDGDNGMIWHMTKPGVWKQTNFQDDTPGDFTSIASGPNGFVVSTDKADGPSVMYSTDGDTWHASSITVAAGLPLIVASYHYGFIAVGSDPAKGGATTAWTSTAGRTWTIRGDWRLPANVTSIVGMGYGFVATASTAIPGTAASALPSSLASAGIFAGASPAKATPTPKPTPSPTLPANLKPTTWWYSASGVSWAKSGLTTSNSGWGMVGGEIVALDAPSKLANNWGVYSSPDGRNWKQSSVTLSFAGSRFSEVASRDNMAVIIGWQADGVLKDFYGWFATGS